jgi:hypothetical protein
MILALTDRDIDELIDVINKLLASIPYDDFSKAGQQSIKYNRLKIQVQEWLYRSTILAFLRGCGVATVAEMHTNLGRADLVLTHRGNVYVIELKVAYKPEEVKTKLAEAKSQIIDNNYAAPYSNVTSIALVIDDTKRQITMSEAW